MPLWRGQLHGLRVRGSRSAGKRRAQVTSARAESKRGRGGGATGGGRPHAVRTSEYDDDVGGARVEKASLSVLRCAVLQGLALAGHSTYTPTRQQVLVTPS